jgi:spore coat polysaccharide biosynthesis protein SpsF
MTLGTAQLGMKYGSANRTGLPVDSIAEAILKRGVLAGVTAVDCARGYELAEQRVGRLLEQGYARGFKVITKLDPLSNLLPDESDQSIRNAVDASVFRSCVELRQKKLDVLLLHRWEHRHAFRGAIWHRLLELRDQGLISRLGASVYTPEAAKEALQDANVQHLQLPFNILDWRWKRSGFWQIAGSRADVVIHARSALLKGILAAPSKYWPGIPGLDANAIIKKLDELVQHLGRESRTDLCLAFVRAHEGIISIVLGMETLNQLDENLRLFTLPALSSDEYAEAEKYIAPVSERLLDPSKWVMSNESTL